MRKLFLSLFIIIVCSIGLANGQVTKESELFLELKEQDSTLFERGFNRCDLEYLAQKIHKDLIFFHDQSGIQDREEFLENTEKNICSSSNQKPIRKVNENSLEVFPLYGNGKLYGAIQKGVHDFYIREAGKENIHTSRAKFTHVWLLENGDWLVKEVLSFDHKDPSQEAS